MGKIGIIFTSCPNSAVPVVLSYITALKLCRFEKVLVDFWPYFTAHARNVNFRGFDYNSDNAMGFSDADFL